MTEVIGFEELRFVQSISQAGRHQLPGTAKADDEPIREQKIERKQLLTKFIMKLPIGKCAKARQPATARRK